MTLGSGSREVGLIGMFYFSKRIPYSQVQSLLDPLSPSIHIQILRTYLHTFP